MTTDKPLAKSLHTITVLVRIAGYLKATSNTPCSDETAVYSALVILGYTDAPDPHGLRAAALKQLGK